MTNENQSVMPIFALPEWVKDSIIYSIFPDRFYRSRSDEVLLNMGEWDTPPKPQEYKGGDLIGIRKKLKHLEKLGINTIYLTPIFQASSNHRYNTHDYYQIDPILGGNKGYEKFLKALRKRKIRLILDGVFSHTGRGFFPFTNILDNGNASPYIDWYTIHDWPLSPYDGNRSANYNCWHNLRELPLLNTDNPVVREYIFKVAEYWITQGIDGWRIDSPKSIKTQNFWEEFYRRMKSKKSDIYIVGEIWQEVEPWMNGKQFDGVTNYLFTEIVLAFFAGPKVHYELLQKPYPTRDIYPYPPINAEQFGEKIAAHIKKFPGDLLFGQLNILSSHDIPRIMTLVGGDVTSVRLAVLFQMTFPGIPCIYYGDEIGMHGGPDPDCRRTFPWHHSSEWNYELLSFYQQLISIRNRYRALRHGSFHQLNTTENIYSYARQIEDQCIVVAINVSNVPQTITIHTKEFFENNQKLYGLISGRQFLSEQGNINIEIDSRQGEIIVTET